MKTRTIPSDVYPWWTCRINHKEYRYPSGATMSVPDEVAAMIDGINAAKKQPEQAYIPHLPDITPADDGKVLKAVGGKWVLAEETAPEPPVVGPLEVDADFSIEAGTITVALDIKAETLYNAIASGKLIKIHAKNMGADFVGAMQARKTLEGALATYTFGFFNDALLPGISEELSGDDDVVLTYTVE